MLPSSSDVPPSGRGVNLSSPTGAPEESVMKLGSQNRMAAVLTSQGSPVAVREWAR